MQCCFRRCALNKKWGLDINSKSVSAILSRIVDVCYFYYRTCPGMKSRYGEVFKQYEQDRRTVILPLGNFCMVALSCIHSSKFTNYHDYFQKYFSHTTIVYSILL